MALMGYLLKLLEVFFFPTLKNNGSKMVFILFYFISCHFVIFSTIKNVLWNGTFPYMLKVLHRAINASKELLFWEYRRKMSSLAVDVDKWQIHKQNIVCKVWNDCFGVFLLTIQYFCTLLYIQTRQHNSWFIFRKRSLACCWPLHWSWVRREW